MASNEGYRSRCFKVHTRGIARSGSAKMVCDILNKVLKRNIDDLVNIIIFVIQHAEICANDHLVNKTCIAHYVLNLILHNGR